jgi:hypothetical protein
MARLPDKSPWVSGLRWLGRLIPGDRLKTTTYLHAVSRPRRWLRTVVDGFWRMDHVYEVLGEFKRNFRGPFSILEFGTASGHSFVKLLYATRHLGMDDQVTVHGFDTFEGLPPPSDRSDLGLMDNDWRAGQYAGDYEALQAYCRGRHRNFVLHKGDFRDTLTPELVRTLREQPPILIWIDCDYYSSSRVALERILPVLRTGAVIYFDDIEFNFGSRFTGQARLVHEVNRGDFGANVELVPDPKLGLSAGRVYRFVAYDDEVPQFERTHEPAWKGRARPISNGSPFP